MLWATIGGTAGSLAGVVTGFLAVIASGVMCSGLVSLHFVSSCVGLADAAPWMLLAGLLLGLVFGSVLGWHGSSWRRRWLDRSEQPSL
jgi:hypothetical protein